MTDAPLLRAEDVARLRRAHIGCEYETDDDKALADLASRLEEILGLVTKEDVEFLGDLDLPYAWEREKSDSIAAKLSRLL